MKQRLRIGTRGSRLALAQTQAFVSALAQALGWDDGEAAARTEIVAVKTTGDRIQDRPLADIGGKALFAKELEEALFAREIDCAVHSLKDLPAQMPEGLVVGACLPREDPRDAFVSLTSATLQALPQGAVLGTSSVRRRALIAATRPDLRIVEFRGNVDTRLDKLERGVAAATVLALAGLKRLGLAHRARHVFSPAEMLPAVAQGAIGIELLAGNDAVAAMLSKIDDRASHLAVALERGFQAALGGSCRTPIAGLAVWNGTTLEFRGCVLSQDGREHVDVERRLTISDSREAFAAGGDAGRDLLARARPGLLVP